MDRVDTDKTLCATFLSHPQQTASNEEHLQILGRGGVIRIIINTTEYLSFITVTKSKPVHFDPELDQFKFVTVVTVHFVLRTSNQSGRDNPPGEVRAWLRVISRAGPLHPQR
ncbi:hypothetical protein RRG08_037432 [Elysia crispata]|uniref:Uncharacterized protein n=1 Tax=Elysia crispata TaxID=231223 RepID=A0AAE1CS83_9GAST|nr:hypothetical protein RRG08_037432 [Elysia crispata]